MDNGNNDSARDPDSAESLGDKKVCDTFKWKSHVSEYPSLPFREKRYLNRNKTRQSLYRVYVIGTIFCVLSSHVHAQESFSIYR